MFADAIASVIPYTFAFVYSLRRFDGSFGSGCATLIVLNEDGWVLSTAHMFKDYLQFQREDNLAWQSYQAAQRLGEVRNELSYEELRTNIESSTPSPECITHYAWLTSLPYDHESKFDPVLMFEEADLAVARFQPFNPGMIKDYPKFKNLNSDFRVGQFLCCLGFAGARMPTSFLPDRELFDMPRVELYHFPSVGILTRALTRPLIPRGRHVRLIEMAAPVLPGQSGGPMFDTSGAIWGLATRTAFESLEFDASARVGTNEVHTPQFASLGQGIHLEQIVAFLDELGVRYQMAS